MTIAFSAVPPMPMPSIPGGHQPAPIVGTVLSTQSTMESEGLSMANLRFGLRAAALGRDGDVDIAARHHLDGHDRGRVVAGVLARESGVGKDAAAELVVRVEVGAANALIDHLLHGHQRLAHRCPSASPCRP